MIWPFKKRKVVSIDSIGPEAPKIKFVAQILGYSVTDSKIKMTICIGDSIISCEVPSIVQTHYPLGTDIVLVLENRDAKPT